MNSYYLLRKTIFLLVAVVTFAMQSTLVAEERDTKYALLIGVTRYEHAAMNGRIPLKFPEDDAGAVGTMLENYGYEVELLLGKDATRDVIKAKLTGLRKKSNSDGIAIVGLFGHGVESVIEEPGGIKSAQGWLTKRDQELGIISSRSSYSLPTEAQWELSTRSGSDMVFSFGNTIADFAKYGNVRDLSFDQDWKNDGTDLHGESLEQRDGYGKLAPAGQFLPNSFGLFDMHGNAAELCLDKFKNTWEDGPELSPIDPVELTGSGNIIRGGCWRDAPFDCRCSSCKCESLGVAINTLGFRLCLNEL